MSDWAERGRITLFGQIAWVLKYSQLLLSNNYKPVKVAVNIYTENALQQYGVVFDRYAKQMKNKRIWVTETGSSNSNGQISWVENFYPKILRVLRPDMICWYIMYDGERSQDNTFGLINNIDNPPVLESDLIKKLIGGVR